MTTPVQFYVAGAPPIIVGTGGTLTNKIAQLLGYARDKVNIEIYPAYAPVMNSTYGTVLPADESYQGKYGIISFVVNLEDMDVMNSLYTSPNPFVANPGIDQATDIGTLMKFEKMTFPVWIPSLYSNKAAYANGNNGFHFFSCKVLAPITTDYSTMDQPFQMILRADQYPVPKSMSNPNIPLTLKLYDFDLSAAGPIISQVSPFSA